MGLLSHFLLSLPLLPLLQTSGVSALEESCILPDRLERGTLDPPPPPRLKSQSTLDLLVSQEALYLFAHPLCHKGFHMVAGATTGTVNSCHRHLLPVCLGPVSRVSYVAKLPEVSWPSKLELAQ